MKTNNIGSEKINIQWYPGHMAKAKRMVEESLAVIDAVCEVLDARIPYSSSNPDIKRIIADKPRLVVLNRCDLADPDATGKWKKYFESNGASVLVCDAKSGRGTEKFASIIKALLSEKISEYEKKGQPGRKIKIMVLGIPNVGKSTFINRVSGKKSAAAADKPGVTRGKQWISVASDIFLLDTPGILWPKFDSQEVGELLALTNAIKSDVFDIETLAANFMTRMNKFYPDSIKQRYKIEPDIGLNGYELLEEAARKRGFLVSGGEYDIERMATTLLNEYHNGKLGRLTLELPE